VTAYAPAYRLRVYAPKSVDRTELTVLTPAASAPHSDPFQVATIPGVPGYQPYLDVPRGRRGKLDILQKRMDGGELTFTLVDRRVPTSGSNLARWVTGFTGNVKGKWQLAGFRAEVDESLTVNPDGTRTDWARFWTGRIQRHDLRDKARCDLVIRDMREDLKMRTFIMAPHPSATGVVRTMLLPPGTNGTFGSRMATTPLRGVLQTAATQTFQGVSFKVNAIILDATSLSRHDNVVTWDLLSLVYGGGVVTQAGGFVYTVPGSLQGARGRVHLKRVDTGAEGEFKLGSLYIVWIGNGVPTARIVTIAELATTEPGYLAMPPDGTTVDLYAWSTTGPRLESPVLINDTHPVQVWKDILDGYYGYLWLWAERDSLPSGVNIGDPKRTVAYDTAAFAALIADARFPLARFVITEPVDAWSWIETNILQPYGLAFYLDASGKVVPLDLRMPTSADIAAAPTVTDADLVEARDMVAWSHDRGSAITRAIARFYIDTPVPPAALIATTGRDSLPHVARAVLSSTDSVLEILDLGNFDLGDTAIEIDAGGFRAMPDEQIDNQDRLKWLLAKLQTMLLHLKAPYGNGAVPVSFRCRRTAVPSGLAPGKLFVSTVSLLPDPQSNRRGGTRVFRCTGKTEDGLALGIEALDLGLSTTAAVPALGTPAQQTGNTTNGAKIAVTLNAQGDPAELQYAVTPTAIGSAPADGSSLWSTFDIVRTTRDATLDRLPSGLRLWFRARSVPDPKYQMFVPSAWVTSTSLDLAGISAPTAPTLITNGAKQFTIGWTLGSTTLRIELLLATPTTDPRVVVATLWPGSTHYTILGVLPSTTYRVGIRHTDGLGGYSSEATIDVTTQASANTLPRPPNIVYRPLAQLY